METPKTSSQHVFGRPSADAAQFTKPRACPPVVVKCQLFDVDLALVDSTSEGQQCADLLLTKPDRLIAGGLDSCYIARRWKRVLCALASSMSHVAHRGQPIEQLETDE
jgi:hypothetical protein